MAEAVLELGTNLGDRYSNIRKVINAIELLPSTRVVKVSDYYETEPFDVPDKQADYINCCVQIETDLEPETLLGCCLGIEASMGRIRTFKNSARIIDVDLLLYEGESRSTKDLTLPHPRMLERGFVLVPLSDIYPEKVALGINFVEKYEIVDKTGVRHL